MLRKIKITILALLMTSAMLPCAVFAGEETTEAPAETEAEEQDKEDEVMLKQKLLEQAKEMLPIIIGLNGNDPQSNKAWLIEQVKKLAKNPNQYSEDFWDSLFGTGADGISKEGDSEKKGKVDFVMELPDPVRMPDTYSVSYNRRDKKKNEIITLLERDADGNIHYADGESEMVFVRTDDGFRMYPVLADQAGFGEWDGVLLSARSVREKTSPFWDCADQTFIKWLGVERTEDTEYLGRPCGLYHGEPGAITFTYKCDLVIDDETGICLCYTADELLKGAVFNITEDNTIQIDIGDYNIGGEEMNFFCTGFETENVSFEVPET